MCVSEIAIRGIFLVNLMKHTKQAHRKYKKIKIILPNNSNDVKDCQNSLNRCQDTTCHTVKSCGHKECRFSFLRSVYIQVIAIFLICNETLPHHKKSRFMKLCKFQKLFSCHFVHESIDYFNLFQSRNSILKTGTTK